MAEVKRVTLHPILEDGSIDTNVNLYPKTLLDGIVDRQGEPVDVALKSDIFNLDDSKVDKEEGKGLSSNDFTDEEKEKLDNLNGGTKLYRHTIVTSRDMIAELIYPYDTPLTALPITSHQDFLSGKLGDDRILSFFADSDNNYAESVYVIQSGGTGHSSIFNYYTCGAFVSDTVTPLTNEETPIK